MVKRYNPHSSIDVSAWIVEDAGGSVVLASDYDALLKLNEAMQHVVNMASLLNNPDDDAGDDDDDYETMIELYFAVQKYRAALASQAQRDSHP
jgi:hypothetical protein